MVLRKESVETFQLLIDGVWCTVDEEVLKKHPGGSAIRTYRNLDASEVFKTFHSDSQQAKKWLSHLQSKNDQPPPSPTNPSEDASVNSNEKNHEDENIGSFSISNEESTKIRQNFALLRQQLEYKGLFDAHPGYYVRKVLEPISFILLAFLAQYHGIYLFAALLMGISWQQLGWLIHDFTHQQVFPKRRYNDYVSYFVGNFLMGFSSGAWKEQHNVHHAAPNVIERDGDLDLVPFYATIIDQLEQYPTDSWTMAFFQWQHVYWPILLPFLRLSWLSQSAIFVSQMETHFFDFYRKTARMEMLTLGLHHCWTIAQLYFLPDWTTRIMFFLVSHLLAGFLLSSVVTFNHYSVKKFPLSSNIMSNFSCLQLLTTRNMRPGQFVDWLWGGLNYQIEHHLFPTMPRHNLNSAMPLVKKFAADNNLPYMVNNYSEGFWLGVEQFRNVALHASKIVKKVE